MKLSKFTAEGFQKYETILGTGGVGLLLPAVFRNDVDGEGGKEIDQEKFDTGERFEQQDRVGHM
jgi:mevalonate kinase